MPDNVLNGALDAVFSNGVDLQRFADPVSADEVNRKKRKGYVFSGFSNFFFPGQVWSLIVGNDTTCN